MKVEFLSKGAKRFGLIAIGFCIGLVVMFLYLQPKLTYQGKAVADWAFVANTNQKEAVSYKEQLASKSAQFNYILSQLKTTPAKDNQSSKTSSNLKTIKGMNCRPINNDGSTDCTEYEYQYDPNATSQPSQLDPSMLQNANNSY